jgi:hypothetical protein
LFLSGFFYNETMKDCFDCYFSGRKGPMKGPFYIEGHKSKTDWEDENTRLFEGDTEYVTLEEATAKAKEYFEKRADLHLVVIYKQDALGVREGARMIFRNDEGQLEESNLFF